MEELKPCPFCGEKAKIDRKREKFFEYSAFRIKCENCESSTRYFPKPEWAVMVWNCRGALSNEMKNKSKEIDGIVSTASKNSPLSEKERRAFIMGLSQEQLCYLAMKMVDLKKENMFDMPGTLHTALYVDSKLYEVGGFCNNFDRFEEYGD